MPEATGNFLGNSVALAGGSDTLTVASLALEIFQIQQLGHVANKALLFSYFYDGHGNFLSIYPASDRYDFQVLGDDNDIEASVRHFFARPSLAAARRRGIPSTRPIGSAVRAMACAAAPWCPARRRSMTASVSSAWSERTCCNPTSPRCSPCRG